MQNKRCTRCEEFKDFGAFNKDKRKSDGIFIWCKECVKAHNRQTLQKLRGIYRAQVRKSKERGHQPPSYTRDEFVDRYLNDEAYTQLHKEWVDSNYDTKLAPSLDRIDNDLGYTFDNIKLMTWDENRENRDKDHKLGKLSAGKAHVAVKQYSKDGAFIQSFISQSEASRVTGVSNVSISSCLLDKQKSAGGFIWKKTKK